MLPEVKVATRIHMVKKKPVKQHATLPLGVIVLGDITRALRTIRNLKGNVYIVGGVVTEGFSPRDLDIVITNIKDIPRLKKALGKFASKAHFIFQKGEPPAPLFLKITGKEPASPDLKKRRKGKKGKLPKWEYATPA